MRGERNVYLTQVLAIGLTASILAAIVLSSAITILYRTSVAGAEDRFALSQATALLSNAVMTMSSREHPSRSEMAGLAMTASHVRALVPDVRGVNIMFPNGSQMFAAGGGRTTQSVPLRDNKGKLLVTVGLSVEHPDPIDPATMAFIIAISLCAIVVSVGPQVVLARRAIGIIVAQRAAAENTYLATLISLSSTLELRDPYTAHHSRRVAAYAEGIAVEMQLPADEIRTVREGALLHDLGKVAVPDAVLLKNGQLDAVERAIIERHPVVGAQVLGDHKSFTAVRACVLHHHERFDDTGYPAGLRGNDLPLGAGSWPLLMHMMR